MAKYAGHKLLRGLSLSAAYTVSDERYLNCKTALQNSNSGRCLLTALLLLQEMVRKALHKHGSSHFLSAYCIAVRYEEISGYPPDFRFFTCRKNVAVGSDNI